jgi:hypothetical protein
MVLAGTMLPTWHKPGQFEPVMRTKRFVYLFGQNKLVTCLGNLHECEEPGHVLASDHVWRLSHGLCCF